MLLKMIRITTVAAVITFAAFLTGCGNDSVGSAARSSLTSFVQSLTNTAITSVLNP